MTAWKISVNMEQSVWTLSMATSASVKRVSGEHMVHGGEDTASNKYTYVCGHSDRIKMNVFVTLFLQNTSSVSSFTSYQPK